MGYHYRDSGYGYCDCLITTKNGETEGGLPKGIVILTGTLYSDPSFKHWLKENEKTKEYHVYCAKHCENENEFTHITEFGRVNRFGFFITKEDAFANDNSCYDIGKGCWLKRIHVNSFREALEKLN